MLKNSSTETKIAILEEKVSMYEEMLGKIDSAIQKISDANNNITKMLAIHEERLEQTVKSDSIIIKMVDDVKTSFTKEINILHKNRSLCVQYGDAGRTKAKLMFSAEIINEKTFDCYRDLSSNF